MVSLKHMPGSERGRPDFGPDFEPDSGPNFEPAFEPAFGPDKEEGPLWQAAWVELRELAWLVAVVCILSLAGVALGVVLGWSVSMI